MTQISQLAINEEGFVFNPTTGESYTVNSAGLVVLKGLKENKSLEEMAEALAEQFEVTAEDAEGDVKSFMDYLKAIAIL